jgi:hypothetical protein
MRKPTMLSGAMVVMSAEPISDICVSKRRAAEGGMARRSGATICSTPCACTTLPTMVPASTSNGMEPRKK